jgi:hypothetical protein
LWDHEYVGEDYGCVDERLEAFDRLQRYGAGELGVAADGEEVSGAFGFIVLREVAAGWGKNVEEVSMGMEGSGGLSGPDLVALPTLGVVQLLRLWSVSIHGVGIGVVLGLRRTSGGSKNKVVLQ